jgi:YegS/Rv2252/BmrU family lipid kinase
VNKSLVILNPAARSDKAVKMKSLIEGLPGHPIVRLTSHRGNAQELATRGIEEGFENIIAAGGDGTINEVVNGIAGSDATLGILPVGTMNVFAAELGIPTGNLHRAWDVITGGHLVELDMPMANENRFIQMAGVGLDAEVVRKTSLESKKSLGPLSYLITLTQVASLTPPVLTLEFSDKSQRQGCFALIGNGRYYGGPFSVFKKASLSDGLLDVVLCKNQTHWDVVRYFQAVIFGTHMNLPDVEYFQTDTLRITANTEVPVELDGEVAGLLPCEFKISHKKLRVLVPSKK